MATTAAETRELLDELKKGRVRFLLLQFTDLLGVNKAVEVPASRFEQALAGEVLFDGSALEGFARVEEADALLVPDLASFRVFPWESAETGVEETPVWALSGPFEHHITADVALAAWNYYCVTQDKEWLKQKGWPILSATADFWASRVERNGPGKYEIKNVVAADEWAENVDNNAFTDSGTKYR